MRDEADRLRHAHRPGADDHARQPLGRGEELLDPLLRREPADEEDVRRLLGLADRLGDLDPARDHAHLARAELARRVGEGLRGRDRQPRAAQERPEEPRRPPRELDVGAPELDDERLPGRERGERRREPVRVDEVGVARRAARRARERDEERRQRAARATAAGAGCPTIPWPYAIPKCRNDAGETTSTSTPSARRRLDRVADEEAGDVPLVPRVRRRQDDDLHGRRRAKTIGAASASIANAKK